MNDHFLRLLDKTIKRPLLIENTIMTHSLSPITGLERLGNAILSLATIVCPTSPNPFATQNKTEQQLQKAMKQKNYSELETLIEKHRHNISEEFKPKITTFLQEAYKNDPNNSALRLLITKWEAHLHCGY